MVKTTKSWSEVTANTPQYTVKDSSGKEIEKVGKLADDVKTAKETGGLIYRDSSGNLTTKSSYDDSHITFENGKVTIHAPQSLIDNSDWIKENFLNNNTFKKLTEAYRQDPTGKTEVTVTNSDGTVSQKTLNDEIENYSKAFDEYVNQYKYIQSTKDSISGNTKSGLKLTDNDAIIANNSLLKSSDRNSTTNVMYIPASWDNFFDFSKIASWDPSTRTISAKDWYSVYALDGDNVLGEKAISGIQEQALKDMADYITSDFSEEEKANAATELSRIISAYNTLYSDSDTIKDTPEANFFTTSRIFIESAGHSFLKNVGDVLAGVATVEAGIIDLTAKTINSQAILAIGLTSELFSGELDGDSLRDISALVVQSNKNYDETSLVKQFTDSYEENVVKPYDSLQDRITKLSGAATAGMIVGNLAAEIAKQIVVTNSLGESAKNLVVGLANANDAELFANGVGTILQYGSPAQINSLLNLSTSMQITVAGEGAGFFANILAQGVSDTILNDYGAIAKMFQGEDATELGESFLKNTGFNLVGELSGLGMSKGWNKFTTQTELGKNMQATLQRAGARAAVRKRAILDRLATFVKGSVEKPTGGSDWWQAAYKESSEFSEQIATAAKSAETTAEATTATEKAVINRMEFENWLDDVVSGQQATWKSIVENPDLSGYIKAYQDAATNVIKLEGGSGIDAMGKWFTQDTSNYTVWLQRLNEYSLKGKLSGAEQTMQRAYLAKVAQYEASHSADLVNAAKNFVKSNQDYNQAFTRWELKEKLITEEEYLGWLSSGRYGANGEFFQHTVRVADGKDSMETARALVDDYASAGNYKAKLSVDDFSLKPGDVDANYLDPQLVNYAQQTAAAKVIQGRNGAEIMMKNGEPWKEIDTNGKPVVKSDVTKLKNEARLVAKKTMNSFRVNEDIFKYDLSGTAKQFTGLDAKKVKTERQIKKILGLNAEGLKKAVYELDDNQLKMIADQFGIVVPEPVLPREGKLFQDITPQPRAISATGEFKIGDYDAVASMNKIEAVGSGKLSFDDYLSEQRGLLWESFKNSNLGTESMLLRDELGDITRRVSVSDNGTLYRKLYSEYGGKPPKYAFNEALDDVLAKGEASEYYAGFKELDPDGPTAIFDYNKGSEYIDNIIATKSTVDSGIKAPTKIEVKKTPAYTRQIAVNVNGNVSIRNAILENKEILNSDYYKNMVSDIREAKLNATKATRLNKYYEKYADIVAKQGLVAEGLDEFTDTISRLKDDLIYEATKVFEDNAFAKQLLDRYEFTGVDRDIAKRYLVLSSFATESSSNAKAMNDMLNKNLNRLSVSGNLTTAAKKNYTDAIKNSFKEMVQSDWADSVNAMKNLGVGADLIDMEQYYDAVYKEMTGFIDDVVKKPTVVQVLDREGKYHLYDVSPTTATLLKTRPNMYETKSGAFVRFFNRTNRVFRIGTTGFSVKSFTNQWMRDPLNAYVMGGMVRTIGQNQSEMAELFGEQIVSAMQKEMSASGWEAFAKGMTEEEIAKAATKQVTEGEVARIYGGVGGETAYYRQYAGDYREQMFGKQATGDEKAWKKIGQKMDDWLTKFEDSKLNLGNSRELYLRKSVYSNSLNKALSAGHTLKDAQTIAEFTMRQATTNFSRAFSWGNKITSSVPYLGAAINGSASFWRLLELDPVGVSGRFISGLVLPAMSLTAQSLANENDREIYKNIPEYIKQDNLVFVIDGQTFKMPIPQELSTFVAPFRQVVEKSYGVNNNSWLELISSDLLNISPVDLSGFINLDEQKLASDETFWSTAVGSEVETLISQLSPVVVKSAYMLLTGRDPYTGDDIDTSYKYFDDDGNLVVMDYTDNAVAKWMSDILGKMGLSISPATAEAILGNFFGTVGGDLGKTLTSLFGGNFADALENTVGQVATPFSVYKYAPEADKAWKDAVSILENKKNELLSASGDLNKISTQMSKLDRSDPNYDSKLTNLRKQRYAIVQEYQDDVLNAVKDLEAQYGNDYDRKKFAATINLLTFDTSYTSGNTQAALDANQEVYYNARNEALQTMADLGFSSPSDLSIFGYMAKQPDGSVKLKTYSPTAIMNTSEAAFGAGDIYQADINAILSNAGIKRSDMFGSGYNDAKARGKSALKQYKADWNSKVIKVLYAYVQDKGIDNLLNDHKTQELIDDYIFVDNMYNTKNYLKEIFK